MLQKTDFYLLGNNFRKVCENLVVANSSCREPVLAVWV